MQGLSPVPPRPKASAHIDPDRAAYRVTEKRGFFDETDRLWEKGSMIYWEGEPSIGFEPLNDKAEDAMRTYLQKLDDYAKEVAEKKGTGYASQVNAFEATRRLRELDDRSVVPEEKINILQGAKDKNARAATSIEDGADLGVPLMGTRKNKKKADVIDG